MLSQEFNSQSRQPVEAVWVRTPSDTAGQRIGAGRLIQNPCRAGSGVGHDRRETANRLRPISAAGFEFDGHAFRTAVEDQVRFDPSGRAPEEELRVRILQPFAANDVFNDERLPARAVNRVVFQFRKRLDVE